MWCDTAGGVRQTWPPIVTRDRRDTRPTDRPPPHAHAHASSASASASGLRRAERRASRDADGHGHGHGHGHDTTRGGFPASVGAHRRRWIHSFIHAFVAHTAGRSLGVVVREGGVRRASRGEGGAGWVG